MSQPFPTAPQILTQQDFLDEIQHHVETREPGDTIRLSRLEANYLMDDLQAQSILYPDGKINTGDRLYGFQIEIRHKRKTFNRWGTTTFHAFHPHLLADLKAGLTDEATA